MTDKKETEMEIGVAFLNTQTKILEYQKQLLAITDGILSGEMERVEISESRRQEDLASRESHMRDIFALAAMEGMLSGNPSPEEPWDLVWLAATSYKIADAMMAERAKGGVT